VSDQFDLTDQSAGCDADISSASELLKRINTWEQSCLRIEADGETVELKRWCQRLRPFCEFSEALSNALADETLQSDLATALARLESGITVNCP
jgi:hypothetical protein